MTKSVPLLTWLIYPFTLLESAAMVVAYLILTTTAHVYYSWLWLVPKMRRSDKYTKWAEVMSAESGLEAMNLIEEIITKSGANAFWLSGTLLGLERCGRPLDHDHDLDLGIMIEDPNFRRFDEMFKSSPSVLNYSVQHLTKKMLLQNPDLRCTVQGALRTVAKVRSSRNQGSQYIKVDVFYHFNYRNGIIHASPNSIWWNSPFSTKLNSYGKFNFHTPANTHLHLTENYGDYKMEVKEFENSVDCPNTMNIYSWTSLVYLLRRKTLLIKLGKTKSIRRINKRIYETILKGAMPRGY